MLRPPIGYLPPSLRVFAVDQRGQGDAAKPKSGYSLHDSGEDVVAFLDALGIASAVLLGSSSGGYVAQQVAIANPYRVAGLFLAGAPRSLHGRPPFADEVDRLADPMDPEWVRAFLTWFPRFHDVPAWYIEDRVRDGVRAPAHVWRLGMNGLTDAIPPTDRATIRPPTVIVRGDRDEMLPQAEQEQLAAAIPGSTLEVYDNTGHLVLWEQPEQLAADLTAFVEGLSREGPVG